MHRPIGIFDSGVGGLTVASAIISLLPEESFIYYGDTTHAPYGDKSGAAIKSYSRSIVNFLLQEDCKAIVIACNTASAVAYDDLRKAFPPVEFINVVDPVVEAVAKESRGKVGIIATRATTQSGVYALRLKELAPAVQTVAKATPLFAPLIEEGFVNTAISEGAIHAYLDDPEFQDIDTLILGCTHYPLLQREIEAYYGGRTRVLDSPAFVAQKLRERLESHSLLSPQKSVEHRFYVSEQTQAFESIARRFFGAQVEMEEKRLSLE